MRFAGTAGFFAGMLTAVMPLAASPAAHAAEGDSLWCHVYGGTDDDLLFDAIAAPDGGYLLVGASKSAPTYYEDVYLVKVDSAGMPQSTHFIGPQVHWRGYAATVTPDSGYFVAGAIIPSGSAYYDLLLLRTNANGDSLWSLTWGGAENDDGRAIAPAADGGCVIAGATGSFGHGLGDAYVVCTDASGSTRWWNAYGGARTEWASALVRTRDGGYLVAGQSNSYTTDLDWWVVRIDASGDTLWTRTYGLPNSDYLEDAIQTSDGGFMLVGSGFAGGGLTDAVIVKTDSLGVFSWRRSYGGVADDDARGVIECADGGCVVTGSTKSYGAGSWDMWVLRLEPDGALRWQRTFGGSASDEGRVVMQAGNGDILVAAETWSWSASGRYDFWLGCLEGAPPAAAIPPLPGRGTIAPRLHLTVSPNPAGSAARARYETLAAGPVRLSIYDVTGRLAATVVDAWQPAGTHEARIDASLLPGRLGIARLETAAGSATAKIVRIE